MLKGLTNSGQPLCPLKFWLHDCRAKSLLDKHNLKSCRGTAAKRGSTCWMHLDTKQDCGSFNIYLWCTHWHCTVAQVELHSLLFAVESTEQPLLGTHRETVFDSHITNWLHESSIGCAGLLLSARHWCLVGVPVHYTHCSLSGPQARQHRTLSDEKIELLSKKNPTWFLTSSTLKMKCHLGQACWLRFLIINWLIKSN